MNDGALTGLAQDPEFARKILASLAGRVRMLELAAGAQPAAPAADGWTWPIPGLA